MGSFTINDYKSTDYVGSGCFGEVWQARHQGTGKIVAIKVLSRRKSVMDSVTEEHQWPDHPHVQPHEVAEGDDLYIINQLRPSSVHAKAGRAFNDAMVGVHWFEQAAQGLAAAHELGWVHGHLKGTNLLLDEKNRVVVSDFHQIPVMEYYRTLPESVWYVPPEQALGGEPSPTWDVYALGALFYNILTGMPPRQTKTDDAKLEKLKRPTEMWPVYAELVSNNPLAPMQNLNPNIDKKLAHIIEKCLELDPRRRPTMAQLWKALQVYLGKLEAADEDPETAAARKKRLVMTWALAGVLVVVGLGAFGVRQYQLSKAAKVYEIGQKWEEDGKPGAEAFYAQAVIYAPTERKYREAATRARQKDQSLVYFKNMSQDRGTRFIAVSPRGDLLVAGDSPGLYSYSGGVSKLLAEEGKLVGAAFDAEGSRLVTCSAKAAKLWDLEKEEALRAFDTGGAELTGVAISPDGKFVAVGLQNAGLLFEAESGKRLVKVAGKGSLASITPKTLAFLEKSGVTVKDFNGKVLRIIPGQMRFVVASPTGKVLLAGDGSSKTASYELDSNFVHPIQTDARWGGFTADGRRAITINAHGRIQTWDPASGQPLNTPLFHFDDPKQVSIGASGNYAALLHEKGVEMGRALPFFSNPPESPDADLPPALLDLECQLYSGARASGKELLYLEPSRRAANEVEWERQAQRHAQDQNCNFPSSNLWRRYRSVPVVTQQKAPGTPTPGGSPAPTSTPAASPTPGATP